jgi:hypothetical protein
MDRLWWSPCEAWRVCAVVSSPLVVVTLFWAGICVPVLASSGSDRQERKAGGYLPRRRWVELVSYWRTPPRDDTIKRATQLGDQ